MRQRDGSEPSLVDLVRQVQDDLTALVRQEIQLARTELHEIAAHLARNAVLLAVALVAAAGAGLLLLAAIAYGVWTAFLAAGVPAGVATWLAPLVVAALAAVLAAILARRALSALRQRPPVPRETIASITETRQWIKERTS